MAITSTEQCRDEKQPTVIEDGTVHYAIRSKWHTLPEANRKLAFHQAYASELMGAARVLTG